MKRTLILTNKAMSLAPSCIFLNTSKGAAVTYDVRPLVVFNILDHYQRRAADQFRVVGTLLGTRTGLHTVAVTNSFPVPHTETDDSVALNMDIHNKFLDMYTKINPDEVIVGWYSTGNELRYTSALIHETYGELNETGEPLHLLVDASLQHDRLDVKGYTAQAVGMEVLKKHLYTKFTQVIVDVKSLATDAVAVDALIKGLPSVGKGEEEPMAAALSDFERFHGSLTELRDTLNSIAAYLDQVEAGSIVGNPAVGAALAEALAAMPQLNTARIEGMLKSSRQDAQLTHYLANLTATQVKLADRIHNMA